MSKYTAWVPANVKPARPGVYQIHWYKGATPFFRRWDGHHWFLGAFDAAEAAESESRIGPGGIHDKWRGLTEKAK
jgi:hypothetical protein